MAAREKGYMLRTMTPLRACEEDGLDLRENLREFAQAVTMCREIEKEFKLEEGSLDFLLPGNFATSTMGEEVESAEVQAAPDGEKKTQPKKGAYAAHQLRSFLNQSREAANAGT